MRWEHRRRGSTCPSYRMRSANCMAAASASASTPVHQRQGLEGQPTGAATEAAGWAMDEGQRNSVGRNRGPPALFSVFDPVLSQKTVQATATQVSTIHQWERKKARRRPTSARGDTSTTEASKVPVTVHNCEWCCILATNSKKNMKTARDRTKRTSQRKKPEK